LETHPLAQARKALFPLTLAHFPSKSTWQPKSSPQVTETVAEIPGGSYLSRASGDERHNQGKKTAGIDGKTALLAHQRLTLVQAIHPNQWPKKALPVRRIYIPKPGKKEQRPLGIPTIAERARQMLVKLALEPEWEAKFEPNSYGFRPGRSCHDAIEAIFKSIFRKDKYVLDADIKGCFDHAS
jgi:retron-type reverse transcriptase